MKKEKVKVKNNQTKQLHFFVTEAEHVQIKDFAKKYDNGNVSRYVRKCIFDKKFTFVTVDENVQEISNSVSTLIYEIKKIGTNYNQIARNINSRVSTDEMKKLVEKSENYLRLIHENSVYMMLTTDKLNEKNNKK
jgi:hypothetical protein